MEDAALKRGIALWLGYFTGRYGGEGKEIGHANADIIREAAKHHEVGLHARSPCPQAHSSNWDRQTMVDDIARGLRTTEEIIGQPVTCSAAAGWRADQQVIEAKKRSICATTAIVVGLCRFVHCSKQENPARRKFR